MRGPRRLPLALALALASCVPSNVGADGNCDVSLQCASGLSCLARPIGQGPCNGGTTERLFCTLPCTTDADCAGLPNGFGRIPVIWTCGPSCQPDAGVCTTL